MSFTIRSDELLESSCARKPERRPRHVRTQTTFHETAIPAALEKAMRYRLLNEPGEAESICHDSCDAIPDNQQALVMLLLALTDRFGKGYAVGATQAHEVLPRLQDPYERAYYAGIIHERRAKAQLQQGSPAPASTPTSFCAKPWTCFEKAEAHPPARTTTTRCCAGTPAPASSCRTTSSARRGKGGAATGVRGRRVLSARAARTGIDDLQRTGAAAGEPHRRSLRFAQSPPRAQSMARR